jgi:YfiH family protein
MATCVATVPALSAVPGLVHGFERRCEPRARESRDETRDRVGAALGQHGRLHLLRQVHGARVVLAPWDGTPAADAAIATRGGDLLGIETADCLPILIVDPEGRRVAAVHAGWRGTAARIAAAAVRALVAQGSRVEALLAALGPSIGPCCYEVGDELRAAFGEDAPQVFLPGRNGKPRLDLRGANLVQLTRAGIRRDKVVQLDECTRCRADLYYSYRRDGPGAGRMISYVGFAR